MPVQFSKYLTIIILLLSSSLAKANIDSTKSKFFIEFNIETLLGRSMRINQENVFNHNRTSGLGVNVGYHLIPSHHLKMGINIYQSNYHYKLIRKDIIGPDGLSADILGFKEEVWMNTLALGIMYSKDITSKVSIDIETLLFFEIFNESRKRDGTGIDDFQKETLVVYGISHATKENFIGLKTRLKHKVTSDVTLGLVIGISKERITMPKIENDSIFNLSCGISLTYRI